MNLKILEVEFSGNTLYLLTRIQKKNFSLHNTLTRRRNGTFTPILDSPEFRFGKLCQQRYTFEEGFQTSNFFPEIECQTEIVDYSSTSYVTYQNLFRSESLIVRGGLNLEIIEEKLTLSSIGSSQEIGVFSAFVNTDKVGLKKVCLSIECRRTVFIRFWWCLFDKGGIEVP
jgi:hypothetical protein